MLRWRRPVLPQELLIDGRRIEVVATRRATARGVRLRASSVSGRIEISLPSRGGEEAAAALLKSHHGWIAAQVAKWPRPTPFAPDALVPIDGRPVRIDWQAAHPRTPVLDGDRLRVGGPLASLPGRIERWLKARALAVLEPQTRQLAERLGRPLARVSVGDPASRWGSCAGARGPDGARIAYSWRLILAPQWVQFAIVAHEAAHLVHQDHSAAFHALNRQLDPRTTEARRWLARHGAELHWFGKFAD